MFNNEKKILDKIEKNQQKILKLLEELVQTVSKLETEQKAIKRGVFETLRNTFILYGKSVLTRLNLIELSSNQPISVSENEMREIENSKKDRPDPNIFVLPNMHKSAKNKKSLN